MRKSPVSYAPRGVTKKAIALRLLAPELAKHESLAEEANTSSAAFARQMYLRGLQSFERTEASRASAPGINTDAGVNRA
jgi:hypothetical protein